MPYSKITQLPATVKVLPTVAQKMFLRVFNTALPKYGETKSFKIAWSAVKKKFKKVDDKWVANSASFEQPTYLYFDTTGTNIIKNSEDELIMERVLTTTDPNTDGFAFTTEDLATMEQQINDGGGEGDVDHEYLNKLISLYGDDTQKIIQEIRKKRGIAKGIKAKMTDNKLWLQAKIDKRYKNHIDKYKYLSVEAVKPNNTSPVQYLGFTLTNKPRIPNMAS